ncbi:MAG: peptide ABC transporter substrate-binding protein [Agarilytica sp.]
MKIKFGNIVALLFSCSLLFACSEKSKTPVEIGNELGIFHKGNGTEPSDIDPHTTTGMPEYHIQHAIFEPLVSLNPETLEPMPAVAESWTSTEDGLTYTFTIRKNAAWSNGEPVTANDFVYSWKRALMPALGNQYAYSLYVLKNAERFHKGEVSDFSEVGATALNDNTLQVVLEHKTPYFLKLLDHHSLYPVHKGTVEKFGNIDDRGTDWTRAENFVGNGAFKIKEWVPNQVFSVEKNEHYWDISNVSLNEIHFHPVESTITEERMFRSGQLHYTETVPPEKVEIYKQKNAPELNLSPYYGTYFYRINTTHPQLQDVRVRQALAMSIDRKTLTERVTKAGETPAYNLTPPTKNGFIAKAKIEFNPEKAIQLLAEAGYPNGEGFEPIELLYNTNEGHKKIALAIQQMWKNTLNIDIVLHNQEWKVYLDTERTMNYQVSRASWIGDYFDPNTFLDMFVTNGGNNKTGWANERYDELIQLAAKAGTEEERYRYFQEAETILVNEVPIIPIYTYTSKHLVTESVQGIYHNILDRKPYKFMSLINAE